MTQKASVQSVVQLQAQVDASLQNLSQLEVVVRGKASLGDVTKKADETTVVTVQAQLAAAEARLRQNADAASTPRFCRLASDAKSFAGHEALSWNLSWTSRGRNSLGRCLGFAVEF